MWIKPDEQMIVDNVKRVIKDKIQPRAAEIDAVDEFPQDMFDLFRELELFKLSVPEEYGGLGTSAVLFCKVVEEIAKVSVSVANILTQQAFGVQFIIVGGDENQRQKYVPKLASGDWLGAGAITEPNAGSDQGPISTRAVKKGNIYTINGGKCFITWGNIADVITVFAKTNPELGRKGLSAFIIEPKYNSGMQVGKLEKKMGLHGSPTAELIFEDCMVGEETLLGKEGEGFKIAMNSLNHGRLGISALAVGVAQGALDYAWEYCKQRQQFGQSLSEFQGLQFMGAKHLARIEAGRQVLYRAAFEHDQNGPDMSRLAAIAKFLTTEEAMNTTIDAVQMLGGYGYMSEYPLERMMRDAKILQIVEGTNQIQKTIIAKYL